MKATVELTDLKDKVRRRAIGRRLLELSTLPDDQFIAAVEAALTDEHEIGKADEYERLHADGRLKGNG